MRKKFSKLFSSFDIEKLDNSPLSKAYIRFFGNLRIELEDLELDTRFYNIEQVKLNEEEEEAHKFFKELNK